MRSRAKTVAEYLAELPAQRRDAIRRVREVILENLDAGFEEGMQYGMIGYFVPHRVYPAGYHCDPRQPLPYVCLSSQKNYMSLYLMTIYGAGDVQGWFRTEWEKTGRKLDMGKSCIRFRRIEDLALDVIGEAIRRVPLKKYIQIYESVIQASGTRSSSTSSRTLQKTPATATAAKRRAAPTPRTKRRSR